MTIIAGEESRNSEWANDTSSFGQKMLVKMGWAKGKGLGKNQQGTQSNLRALRREDGLGIGASTDTLGEEGFSTTSRNFHGVLANLQQVHGESDERKKKKSKKDRKKNNRAEGSDSCGLTLSQTRVAAGHAKKMREAKDLSKKSAEDMAAIFGMKVEAYQSNSVWGKLSSIGATSTSNSSSSNDVSDKGEERGNEALRSKADSSNGEENDKEEKKTKKKEKKDKKKRKRKELESSESNNRGSDVEPKKKKKKRSKK